MSAPSIQATRTVDASPAQLFAVLARPARHTDIDGADMLRGLVGADDPLTGVGDSFVMNMHNRILGDYQMRNTVVAFEPDRILGWAPQLHPEDGYTDKIGDMKAGGHTYTWVLEPAGDGHTTVTQTYDWSGVTDDRFRSLFPMLSEDVLGDSIERAARAATA
jgi:uncharacterized protein YndB with AHSA1/START domain